jgi:anti-sigma-K factor RskA
MEKEALILRARAELAKLDAEYAESAEKRRQLSERARAFEAQAQQLEESLDEWRLYGGNPFEVAALRR